MMVKAKDFVDIVLVASDFSRSNGGFGFNHDESTLIFLWPARMSEK
jgi:hypothetical protein